MTSKELLRTIYDQSQVISWRTSKTKEMLQKLELKESFYDEVQIDLLLYNLEDMGFVNLMYSSKAGIIGASLTELGRRRVEGD